MIVYIYDIDTGEYKSEVEIQKHPLRDEYLLPPANSLPKAPPTAGKNQVVKINSARDAWELIDDFRGTEYYLPDGSYHKIEKTGEKLPADALDAPPPPTPAEQRRNAASNIDTAAGRARSRFVSDSAHIESEYQRAYSTAVAYIEAGYTGDVPLPVQSHADAYNITEHQAADAIKTMGDLWNQTLDLIRDARLKGKHEVETAPDGSDFDALAQPFIDQLEAIKP